MTNEARVASCLCPGGTRHPDGERIVFREDIGFREAMNFQKSLGTYNEETPEADLADRMTFLAEWYLLHLIASWTLRDEKNKPLPVTKANVTTYVLANIEAAIALAEFAEDLYNERLVLPLVLRAASSSQPSPTNGSTSPTPGPGPRRKVSRPKPSTPSSTEPTRMAATAST